MVSSGSYLIGQGFRLYRQASRCSMPIGSQIGSQLHQRIDIMVQPKKAKNSKPKFQLAKTKTALDAVSKPGRYSFDGHSGLMLNVRPTGLKTWLYRSRIGGVQGLETLGNYPAMTFDKASNLAGDRRISSSAGVNPVETVRAVKAQSLAVTAKENKKPSFADFAPRCLVEFEAADKKSVRAQRLTLARIPVDFAALKLAKISRLDVSELLDTFDAPSAKRHVLALVRVILSKANKRGLIGENPAIGADVPTMGKRDRVLTDAEISTLWHAKPAGVRSISLDALRMQLATAQRLGEVLAMRWDDIDAGVWKIPAHVAKNKREHFVPLSSCALQIIERQPRACAYVFAPTRGDGPMRADTLASVLDKTRDQTGLAHFGTHDLRRTASTRIAKLGISPHVLEAVLNHKTGTVSGVAALYNRYEYGAEKIAALAAWGAELARIAGVNTHSHNVVQIRRTKATNV